ncbi:hypothetical protein NS359_00065 [Curtobacterium oceanosedimentum]|uniref:Uncharacterized protein n=1 Tax=Curtobacterium oceanosedimentum TaxID=465820 RepID=A0A147DVC4_9MICO|nr:hypothetical protein NS359_00065 [Curtobacterium oceanosedimentum]
MNPRRASDRCGLHDQSLQREEGADAEASEHVTLDPSGVLRTLVLQDPGHADVTLTVRGTAPGALRYRGERWTATHVRLHRPMARNGYQYVRST